MFLTSEIIYFLWRPQKVFNVTFGKNVNIYTVELEFKMYQFWDKQFCAKFFHFFEEALLPPKERKITTMRLQ